MPVNPQTLRRNTFSGDGTQPNKRDDKDDQRGEFKNTRGFDPAEGLRRALGENFRDSDDAARVQPNTYARELTQAYTEPMYLSLPNEPQVGIILARLRRVPNDEKPVPTGGTVHFVWEGTQSRARITSIDGLTPGSSVYRFNFWVVG